MVYARVDERSQRQGISVLKLAWLRQCFTALVAAVFVAGCGAPEANEPALYTRPPVESAPAPGLRSVEAAKPSMRLVLDRSFAESARSQWRLPRALHEVSGIAVVGDRIFARADEEAVVFELDATGEHSLFMRLDAASHGGPVRDDFEGITALANDLFLVTSAGLLFAPPAHWTPGRRGPAVASMSSTPASRMSVRLRGSIHWGTTNSSLPARMCMANKCSGCMSGRYHKKASGCSLRCRALGTRGHLPSWC